MVANPWWAPWALNRLIEPLMRSLRVQVPEIAGMKASDNAIDICCGTGALALHYARIGINAVGVDMDPRVIKVAEKKKQRQGLRNVSFQTASALGLPFKDEYFDYASISMSIHENERIERDIIISEMKRVVKKKGALIFIDYKVPLPFIPSSFTSRIVELVAGGEHNEYFKDYIKQGGLGALLKKHGLNEEKRGELGPMEIIKASNAS